MKISSLDISNRFKTLQMRKNRKYPNRVNYPKIIGTNNVQYRTTTARRECILTTQLYEDDDNATYTTDALIDLLKFELCKFVITDNKKAENRKYYNQAFCMQRIGAYNPTPFFIIKLGDLTEKLRKELSVLDRETRDYVLKQAVGRIFEDINPSIFHKSVSKVLKVRFEQ